MNRKSLYGRRFEDYLEAIYRIEREKGIVRIKDIASALRVKPPSVVEYLDNLARQGYVIYKKREYIKLTKKGEEIAKKVLEKHKAIRKFLKEVLMLPEEIAEEDACFMEHGLSNLTIERIKKLLEFIKKHIEYGGRMVFMERLKYFYENSKLSEECSSCGKYLLMKKFIGTEQIPKVK